MQVHAGLIAKTLVLAAGMAPQQLNALLQDPVGVHCHRCQRYGCSSVHPTCPYSWETGLFQQLPDTLVTTPPAASRCAAMDWQLWGCCLPHCKLFPTMGCLQVPELRAACKALGMITTGDARAASPVFAVLDLQQLDEHYCCRGQATIDFQASCTLRPQRYCLSRP